ncbi:MAG: transcription elongation factor GreA [Bacteroidota bacterium]
MSETTYLTKEGYEKLRQELADLKGSGRTEIARQIQEAREKGDLSENAEYDAAKEAQGLLEVKISKLEGVIANSRIIDESEIDMSKAYILSTVKVKNLKSNAEMKYTLVAEQEANLKLGKISVKSPVGKALLGKEIGDVVDITIPAGVLQMEILDITRE